MSAQWSSWLYTSIATRPFGLDIADVGTRVEFVFALATVGLLLALGRTLVRPASKASSAN